MHMEWASRISWYLGSRAASPTPTMWTSSGIIWCRVSSTFPSLSQHCNPTTFLNLNFSRILNICRANHLSSPGTDMITSEPRRWPAGMFGLPERTGLLNDIESFDAAFFGVSAKQAHQMDPQLRLLLEVCYEAILDSGTLFSVNLALLNYRTRGIQFPPVRPVLRGFMQVMQACRKYYHLRLITSSARLPPSRTERQEDRSLRGRVLLWGVRRVDHRRWRADRVRPAGLLSVHAG